jgi:hypothetical protein
MLLEKSCATAKLHLKSERLLSAKAEKPRAREDGKFAEGDPKKHPLSTRIATFTA